MKLIDYGKYLNCDTTYNKTTKTTDHDPSRQVTGIYLLMCRELNEICIGEAGSIYSALHKHKANIKLGRGIKSYRHWGPYLDSLEFTILEYVPKTMSSEARRAIKQSWVEAYRELGLCEVLNYVDLYYAARRITGAKNKPCVPIIAVNIQTGERRTYASTHDASRHLGLDNGCVAAAARGELNKHCKHGGTHKLKGYEFWQVKASFSESKGQI